jgi:hypothetical protein
MYKLQDGAHIVINNNDKIISNSPGNLSRFYNQLNAAVKEIRINGHIMSNSSPVSVFIPNKDRNNNPYDFILSLTMGRINPTNKDEIFVNIGFIPVDRKRFYQEREFTATIKNYNELKRYVGVIKSAMDDNFKKGKETDGREESKVNQ